MSHLPSPGRQQQAGFTLIELLVVVAIIAVLAAILFPVFAKAREKSRQTACLSSQRQIAASILMYAQDHDEELPSKESIWQDINVDKGTLICQSAPKGTTNAYVYVSALSGLALGQINTPQDVYMIGDGDKQTTGVANTLDGLEDWDYRHDGSVIIGFVDGHAVLTKEKLPPFPLLVREKLYWWMRADTNVNVKLGSNGGSLGAYVNNTGQSPAGTCTTPPIATGAMAGFDAVRFNGTNNSMNDYGYLWDNKADNNNKKCDRTLVMAFRPTNVSTGTIYWSRGSVNMVRLNGGNIEVGWRTTSTNTNPVFQQGPAVSANKIHYLIATWSETDGASIYLDKVDAVTKAPLPLYNDDNGSRTFIGALNGGAPFYAGDVSEFFMFTRLLNESELDLVHRYMTYKYNIQP